MGVAFFISLRDGYPTSQRIKLEAVSQSPQGKESEINMEKHFRASLYISASHTEGKQRDGVFNQCLSLRRHTTI